MASAQSGATAGVLAAAIQAEREAHQRLRDARVHLASQVIDAVAAGARYDELARLSIRTTTGRSATLDERRREVDRLRQIVRRCRMTVRHDIGSRKIEVAPPSEARSEVKETDTMEKLIKRTTIEETFATDGVDGHRPPDDEHEDDDLEGDGADDEPDAATHKSRRR